MNIHPKVGAAGIGSSVAVIVLWGLHFLGFIPAPVQDAIAGLIVVAASWLAPHLPAEPKP